MEIGPEGDGGWDVVIDDSCDWVQDRKITLPKVAATLNLHGSVPYATYCCILGIHSPGRTLLLSYRRGGSEEEEGVTGKASGNMRSEKGWHSTERIGNKDQADCQLPSLPSH